MTDINVGALSEAINDKLDRDAGNITTAGKETMVGWTIPDYSSPITGVTTSPYTCTCDCMMIFTSDSGQRVTLTINGTEFFSSSTYSSDVWIMPLFFKKGMVVGFSKAPSKVFPLLGG